MRLITYILLVAVLVPAAISWGAVTSLTVVNKTATLQNNIPITFGMVFKDGDVSSTVTADVGGTTVTTQVDAKTRYSSGCLRHATISLVIPSISANGSVTVSLTASAASNDAGVAMTKAQVLATDVGAVISATDLSDSGYSGNVSADLRATINAASSLTYWLQGGVCTELLVNQRLNNSLNATWEVRFYPGTPYIRISHAVENVEANYRGNVKYTVNISQGNASPVTVYGPKNITHLKSSRWRKVFWLGTAPPEVELHYDTNYLVSTGHIMPYDTSLSIADSDITSMASTWSSRDTDIYGKSYDGGSWLSGFANMNFGVTGGRPEIGLLPKWTAMYLLSWDNRLREITLRQAELLANAPVHWREYDASKSFNGKIINIDDRPKVRTTEDYATGTNYDPLPAAIGTTTNPWTVDRAHQGSFNYIPYLITGEYFYLQELYYWAGWDLSQSHWDPSWGRNYSNGWVQDQIRGVAWALRNIADAAALAPDSDAEKAYFNSKIINNINYRATTITTYPLRNMSGDDGAPEKMSATVTKATSPWMEDYCLLSFVHIGRLGFDTSNIIPEYSKFIIGRFSNPDFNWFNGASYRFPTTTTSGIVQTWAEANSLYTTQPTSFANPDYPYSYNFVALAGLSQITNQTNGLTAYNWLKSKVNSQDLLSTDPTWAFVPSANSIPGVCGSSNGLALSSAPVTDLCTAGTPSAVSGIGPWSWSCAGSGGGSTANCGATLLEVPSTGNASALVACPVIAGFR